MSDEALPERRAERVELRVRNLDCENDAARLRRGLEGLTGITDLRILPKAGKLVAKVEGADRARALRTKVSDLGFPPVEEQRPSGGVLRDPKVLTSVASGALVAIAYASSKLGAPHFVVLAIALASLASGAWYFGREAVAELIRERRIGIELLMLIAAVAAVALGELLEAAMLAFLYSISEAAEGYTEQKTRAAIAALMDLAPKVATLLRDGQELEVAPEELERGDVFLVRPGQSMPTDGIVRRGRSSVNQAPVTGESVPVIKEPEDRVFAGTLNGEGALEVEVTATSAENTIARIVAMVEEAQERKAATDRFVDRFGRRYSPLVLLVAVTVAVAAPVAGLGEWATWLTRATVFIVAAAPCALVISIPITMVATLGTAARHGVLIKGGTFVEELARIRVVALDKTGTITQGEPQVVALVALQSAEDDLIALAAAVERFSQHPLAKAIVRHAEEKGVATREAREFQSITGAGAHARIEDATIYVASPRFYEQRTPGSVEPLTEWIAEHERGGSTVVLVARDEALVGAFAIRDVIRPNAKAAIEALHRAGVARVVMLTGDNERTARAIARDVGIDEVFADLSPEGKVEQIRALHSSHGHVAMVGDGVNDAPALAAAAVGVAMGAAGTDVAIETADVALMGDDLERLAFGLRLAKRSRSVVRQNLTLSAVVIAALVATALTGAIGISLTVIAHELSEFVVIASALRMLRA